MGQSAQSWQARQANASGEHAQGAAKTASHDYTAAYARATFCLQPFGDTASRKGFYDSLAAGCGACGRPAVRDAQLTSVSRGVRRRVAQWARALCNVVVCCDVVCRAVLCCGVLHCVVVCAIVVCDVQCVQCVRVCVCFVWCMCCVVHGVSACGCSCRCV